MKFLPLVWAGLWRKPLRTIFTALSIVIAFLLIGLLHGVNEGFAETISKARRDFLTTDARVRGSPPMPIAMMDKIKAVPGVIEVVQRAYFIGEVRSPHGVAAIATDPRGFFKLRPMLAAKSEYLDAMERVRPGLLATPALLKLFEWKIGDTVTLRSRDLKLDGSGDWTFDIVGTFDSVENPNTATFAVINYAYLDEARAMNRGTVERFYVRIADPKRSVATAAAIDAVFANSSHETRTRSDQERAEADSKQMGDIAFFMNAIMAAVLFTLLFVTSNTLRQSVSDRMMEFGVLKTVGFSGAKCFALATAEAMSIYVVGALVGLALAAAVAPLARDIATVHLSSTVVIQAIALAIALSLIGAALPSWRVYRVSVVDSLANR